MRKMKRKKDIEERLIWIQHIIDDTESTLMTNPYIFGWRDALKYILGRFIIDIYEKEENK